MMRHIYKYTCTTLAALCISTGAHAACYIDYKAKKLGDGLRLHYGVMQLSDAECSSPKRSVNARLSSNGWTLLRMIGTVAPTDLSNKKADAGEFYLRY